MLRWHASSGTRGSGTLATVAKTGQQQLYWGIFLHGPLMTARVGPEAAGLGGGSMSSGSYADFLGEEYLASYLPAGGGSVKLVVRSEEHTSELQSRQYLVC